MKNKFVAWILLALMLSSCIAPKYLPTTDETGTNPYGSQIRLSIRDKFTQLDGELIAIDESYVLVLVEDRNKQKLFAIERKDIEDYQLRYAKASDYIATIVLFPLLTVLHGFALSLTMPLNLIVTSFVAYGAENSHTYGKNEMKLDELKAFARFPQGIPSNITLDSLQNTIYKKGT